MKRATRELLKMKGLGKNAVVPVKHSVSKKSKYNECFDNAITEMESSGSYVVGGWLISEYTPGYGSFATPHAWNATKDTMEHYDTTPFKTLKDHPKFGSYKPEPENWEYVIDRDITERKVNGNNDMPETIVIKV